MNQPLQNLKNLTLLAMPFLGEFGWHLARWQGHIRHLSDQFKETVVYCIKGYEYLYKDFASIIPISVSGGRANMYHRYGDYKVTILNRENVPKSSNGLCKVSPSSLICESTVSQHFIAYGESNEYCKYDAVIHARNDDKGDYGEDRNWSLDKWAELVERYPDKNFASIGLNDKSFHVPHTANLRGLSLKFTGMVLRSSKVCMGPSSAPLIYALLCKCPVLVWTNQDVWNLGNRTGTNKERFEIDWNPLGTDVHVMDSDNGFNPSVGDVYKNLEKVWLRYA